MAIFSEIFDQGHSDAVSKRGEFCPHHKYSSAEKAEYHRGFQIGSADRLHAKRCPWDAVRPAFSAYMKAVKVDGKEDSLELVHQIVKQTRL